MKTNKRDEAAESRYLCCFFRFGVIRREAIIEIMYESEIQFQ